MAFKHVWLYFRISRNCQQVNGKDLRTNQTFATEENVERIPMCLSVYDYFE